MRKRGTSKTRKKMRKQNRQEETRSQQEKAQEAHKMIMFRENLNFYITGLKLITKINKFTLRFFESITL